MSVLPQPRVKRQLHHASLSSQILVQSPANIGCILHRKLSLAFNSCIDRKIGVKQTEPKHENRRSKIAPLAGKTPPTKSHQETIEQCIIVTRNVITGTFYYTVSHGKSTYCTSVQYSHVLYALCRMRERLRVQFQPSFQSTITLQLTAPCTKLTHHTCARTVRLWKTLLVGLLSRLVQPQSLTSF